MAGGQELRRDRKIALRNQIGGCWSLGAHGPRGQRFTASSDQFEHEKVCQGDPGHEAGMARSGPNRCFWPSYLKAAIADACVNCGDGQRS
jgi:hypothetical protein